jgi:hypothetical protein
MVVDLFFVAFFSTFTATKDRSLSFFITFKLDDFLVASTTKHAWFGSLFR